MKMAEDVKVPEGWRMVRLGEIADINMGQSPSSNVVNEREIGIPFLQGNAEFTTKYPIPKKWATKPLKLSKKGDILISVRAPVGAVNKADRDYCIGRGLAAISFKTIDDEFGWFGLIYWKHQLENLSQGSTFEAISKDDLKNLLLIIPESIPEQRKIAEILETIDNGIEKTDRIIEKYKRIKQGLMQDLLTKGIDENGQIRSEETHRFKDSPLGRIPEEWEVVELCNKKATTIITDGSHYSPQPVEDSEYYIVNIENITNGRIKLNTCKKISKEDYKNLIANGCKPEYNDVLFTKDGTIGISLVFGLNENIVLLSSIAILRPSKNLDPYFLKYCLESNHIKKQLHILTGGSALKRVILRDIKNFKIPLPPLPEQKRIASVLSQIDETIEKEKRYKEKLERIKQGLMEDLLTGRVRVNHLINEEVELNGN